jgi:hypothetical protein
VSRSTTGLRSFFSFPDPVNEVSVRVTAAGVALIALLAVVLRRPEPLIVLTYGFVARALTGPRISPLALLSTRVITPRLGLSPRPVPGPPKRFAQALGATVSALTLVLHDALGWHTAAFALAGVMVALTTLESGLGLCVGCVIHAWLVRRRWIDSVECAECADISMLARAGR